MKLLLFDIDGTLLSLAQRELSVFGEALEEAYGTSGALEFYDFAGKTDHQIVLDLLLSAGLALETVEEGLESMQAIYLEMLDRELGPETMTVLPGVRELLAELEEEAEVVLGLQTGNWRGAADIKLSRYGLDSHFQVGAFGDGQADRSQLPALARHEAESRFAASIKSEDVVIIGDTALDVACAKHWEMASVGVATGSTELSVLGRAGADLVVSTLLELDAAGLLKLGR